MTVYYLDTSVAVHALLGEPSAETWFDHITGTSADQLVSSRILRTELTRFLRREELPVTKRNEILDHVGLVRLNEGILTGTEAIADHVKTLDAIHLATAIATGADTVIVTHDSQLSTAATNLGFETLDPIA